MMTCALAQGCRGDEGGDDGAEQEAAGGAAVSAGSAGQPRLRRLHRRRRGRARHMGLHQHGRVHLYAMRRPPPRPRRPHLQGAPRGLCLAPPCFLCVNKPCSVICLRQGVEDFTTVSQCQGCGRPLAVRGVGSMCSHFCVAVLWPSEVIGPMCSHSCAQ